MSDVVMVMKKNKAEEMDGGRKDLFIYNQYDILSKETVEPETEQQREGVPWKYPGTNILGRGNGSAKALG